MRKMFSAMAAALLVGGLAATPAAAAITVGNLSATGGSSLTFIDLTAGPPSLNLTNNGFYQSLNTAYLLYEGVNDAGQDTFLLHFDRSGGGLSVGTVQGSFTFSLASLDTIDNIWASKAELDASDDLDNGVTYDRCSSFLGCLFDPAAVFRGLEPPFTPVFGDFVSITPTIASDNSAPLYTVNYRFTNDGATMDQVRFAFTSAGVPEPATWALMIGGFGLAGAMIRRRRALALA